jgi:nicotinamidase-related amidase
VKALIGSVALGSGVHRDLCELLNGGVAPLLPVDQPIVLIPRGLGATAMPLIDAEPYEFALEPMRAVLVIIDMQRDFLEPGGFGESLGNDVSLLRRTIAPTRRLLDAARAVGLMVIHTREGHRADLADLPPAKKARGRPSLAIGEAGAMGRLLVRGEPRHDIVPELNPQPGEPVIDKPGKGAFYATDLKAILKHRGVAQLIVCGVTTEVCVNTSVREANDRGFDCLVLEDCRPTETTAGFAAYRRSEVGFSRPLGRLAGRQGPVCGSAADFRPKSDKGLDFPGTQSVHTQGLPRPFLNPGRHSPRRHGRRGLWR